jgi:hypothetical protein
MHNLCHSSFRSHKCLGNLLFLLKESISHSDPPFHVHLSMASMCFYALNGAVCPKQGRCTLAHTAVSAALNATPPTPKPIRPQYILSMSPSETSVGSLFRDLRRVVLNVAEGCDVMMPRDSPPAHGTTSAWAQSLKAMVVRRRFDIAEAAVSGRFFVKRGSRLAHTGPMVATITLLNGAPLDRAITVEVTPRIRQELGHAQLFGLPWLLGEEALFWSAILYVFNLVSDADVGFGDNHKHGTTGIPYWDCLLCPSSNTLSQTGAAVFANALRCDFHERFWEVPSSSMG